MSTSDKDKHGDEKQWYDFPDLIAGPKWPAERPIAVDLHAVGASEIAKVPDAVLEGQLAMRPGDVLKVKANVARLPAADRHDVRNQGNRVAAADRHQLAKMLHTHVESLDPMQAR